MEKSIELNQITTVITELFTIARENALTTATNDQIETLDENYLKVINNIIPYIDYVKSIIGDKETIKSSGRTNVPVILYPITDDPVTVAYQKEGVVKYDQPPLNGSIDRRTKYPRVLTTPSTLVTTSTRKESRLSRPLISSISHPGEHVEPDRSTKISPRQWILNETRIAPEVVPEDVLFKVKVNIPNMQILFLVTINPYTTYTKIIETAVRNFGIDPDMYDLIIDEIRVDPSGFVHYSALQEIDQVTLSLKTEPKSFVYVKPLFGSAAEVRYSPTNTFGDIARIAEEQLGLGSGNYTIIYKGESMPDNMIVGDRGLSKIGNLHLISR